MEDIDKLSLINEKEIIEKRLSEAYDEIKLIDWAKNNCPYYLSPEIKIDLEKRLEEINKILENSE